MLESHLGEAVLQHLTERLPLDLALSPSIGEIERVQKRLATMASEAEQHVPALLESIDRATIMQGRIDVALIDQWIAEMLDVGLDWINPAVLRFSTGFQYRKRGVETKLIIGAAPTKVRDDVLLRNIARAQQFYDAIKQGQSFEAIGKSEGLSTRRVMQILDLAFLSPTIVKSIVTGEQPMGLTTKWLSTNAMPSDWQAQRQIIATL